MQFLLVELRVSVMLQSPTLTTLQSNPRSGCQPTHFRIHLDWDIALHQVYYPFCCFVLSIRDQLVLGRQHFFELDVFEPLLEPIETFVVKVWLIVFPILIFCFDYGSQ